MHATFSLEKVVVLINMPSILQRTKKVSCRLTTARERERERRGTKREKEMKRGRDGGEGGER